MVASLSEGFNIQGDGGCWRLNLVPVVGCKCIFFPGYLSEDFFPWDLREQGVSVSSWFGWTFTFVWIEKTYPQLIRQGSTVVDRRLGRNPKTHVTVMWLNAHASHGGRDEKFSVFILFLFFGVSTRKKTVKISRIVFHVIEDCGISWCLESGGVFNASL